MIRDKRGKAPRYVIVGEPTAYLLDQDSGRTEAIGERPYSTVQVIDAWFALNRARGVHEPQNFVPDRGAQAGAQVRQWGTENDLQ